MNWELRAVIEIEVEELLKEFDDIGEDWVEGYISTGEAIEQQNMIRETLKELRIEIPQ